MISIPLSQVGSAEAFAAEVEAHRELIESLIVRTPATGPVAKRGPDKITVAPYEIVPPTLDESKAALVDELNQAAQAALNAVLSPARQQLLALDIGPAMAVEKDKRTPAQQATIALQASFGAAATAINRKVIEARVEIEDLTAATIGAWKQPAF
jgi:hypothetical protein